MGLSKEKPLVSIVIPCYNHERYVQECIKSVIAQDYENIELIIIDDGSKDESVSKIQELVPDCEKRFIRFEFRARPNKGLCATLNEAIELASGFFIVPIASDDEMYPNKISEQVKIFKIKSKEEPDLVAIYSGVEYVDDSGNSIRIKKGSGKFCGFKEVILRNEFLPTPSFMVIKQKLIDVGCFNPNYSIEDFYIRLKLTENGGVFYVMPSPLVKYRRHDDNLSKKSDLMLSGVSEILDEYQGYKIYRKAVARSLLIQAHDYQLIDLYKGIKYAIRAVIKDPSIMLTKSMFKFIVKIIYKPKY